MQRLGEVALQMSEKKTFIKSPGTINYLFGIYIIGSPPLAMCEIQF